MQLTLFILALLAHSAHTLAAPFEAYSCASIPLPTLRGATILSLTALERHNYTVPAAPPLLAADVPNLDICDVTITLTHPHANDTVTVQVWLPLHTWNSRFVATGGTAWAAGTGAPTLAPVAAQGFAAASTDAGVSSDLQSPPLWALNEEGKVNEELLTNFASRSIHDMAVVAKAVAASFYGAKPKYAYWSGCSTGGRQGLVAAQQFPQDFDGILAGAPAISWDKYVVAEQWPQVVMKEAGVFPSKCEFAAVTAAAIEACDGLDGVKDGVISNIAGCKFDPFTVVGKQSQCEEKDVVITSSIAAIVKKIWAGPKTACGDQLWDGLSIGAPLDSLAQTDVVNGTRIGVPFFINDGWIKYFLKGDPNFNTSTIDSSELTRLFHESTDEFHQVIGSDDADLSALRESGGKLLVWQGGADQLIFPQGTERYRQNVEKRIGNADKVDEFFRLFIAPGVDHCGQGTTVGAIPSDPFGALMAWVEKGVVPDMLAASMQVMDEIQFTRDICRYPLVSKYRGYGDPKSAKSFKCMAHY